MKHTALYLAVAIVCWSTIDAQVIKLEPKYIKDAVINNPATEIEYDTLCTELTIPDVSEFVSLENYRFPNLKKITFNNLDYLPGGVFHGMPHLEEVVFDGLIGHFDCTMAGYCPELRSIKFRGPVSTTGGPILAYKCPKLEEVSIEGLVCDFGIELFDRAECPKLTKIDISGGVLSGYDTTATPVIPVTSVIGNKRLMEQAKTIARWQISAMRGKEVGFLRKCSFNGATHLLPILEIADKSLADSLKAAMEYARKFDELKSYVEILQESPEYAPDHVAEFIYSQPNDSMLSLSKHRFNLDSIAGTGSDFERAKRLMYWVHNNIRHDGSSSRPNCGYNLRDIYDVCQKENRGVNCRMLAIVLTEALLAEGIPSRYITCESKRWDTDNDCHVICVAWSRELDKWIWLDPTFAAFVSDNEGTPLHPGEVRDRLRKNMPLVLNSDANWNNRQPQTKEEYLDEYMAKNLYIMSCNFINQAEPEGPSNHKKGAFVALVPQHSNYTNAHVITTDDNWFWQAPK